MNRILLFLFPFILSSIIVLGQSNQENYKRKMKGEWIWIKTDISFSAGQSYKTPKSTGITERLVVDRNKAYLYQNDSLYSKSNYKMLKGKGIDGDIYSLDWELYPGHLWVIGDTLRIGYGACATTLREYIRK